MGNRQITLLRAINETCDVIEKSDADGAAIEAVLKGVAIALRRKVGDQEAAEALYRLADAAAIGRF